MPRNGELAFMIYPNMKVVAYGVNNNSDFQRECAKNGNCFKTRKEAEAYRDRLVRALKWPIDKK